MNEPQIIIRIKYNEDILKEFPLPVGISIIDAEKIAGIIKRLDHLLGVNGSPYSFSVVESVTLGNEILIFNGRKE